MGCPVKPSSEGPEAGRLGTDTEQRMQTPALGFKHGDPPPERRGHLKNTCSSTQIASFGPHGLTPATQGDEAAKPALQTPRVVSRSSKWHEEPSLILASGLVTAALADALLAKLEACSRCWLCREHL